MNHFAQKLISLTASEKKPQNWLIQKTGETTATISRIFNGYPASAPKASAIIQAFDEAGDRQSLIQAWLMDRLGELGLDYNITVGTSTAADLPALLPDNLREALIRIAYGCMKHEEIAAVVQDVDRLVALTQNAAEADWHIDDEEKADLLEIVQLEGLSPRLAYRELDRAAPELLTHLLNRLADADEKAIDRTARAIWNDDAFVRLVKLALQHEPAPLMAAEPAAPILEHPPGYEGPAAKAKRLRDKLKGSNGAGHKAG